MAPLLVAMPRVAPPLTKAQTLFCGTMHTIMSVYCAEAALYLSSARTARMPAVHIFILCTDDSGSSSAKW